MEDMCDILLQEKKKKSASEGWQVGVCHIASKKDCICQNLFSMQ